MQDELGNADHREWLCERLSLVDEDVAAMVEHALLEGRAVGIGTEVERGHGVARVVREAFGRLVGRGLQGQAPVAAGCVRLPARGEVERPRDGSRERPLELVPPLISAHHEELHRRLVG